MVFLRTLFKIVAALLGLPLTLGGFGGFWYGINMIFVKHNPGFGIAIVNL